MEILQFQNKHVEDAARLFVKNFKILRSVINELPDTLEDVRLVESLLSDITKKNPSLVAISRNKLIGYLSGWTSIKEFFSNSNGTYTPEWGHSSIQGSLKKEIYQNLYKEISKLWVYQKCYNHLFQFFSIDKILKQLFYDYCYGLHLIDGIRTLEPVIRVMKDDVIIRKVVEDDLIVLQEMCIGIMNHLNESPVYLNRSAEKKSLKDTKKNFMDDDIISVVAEKDGEIVSCIRGKLHGGNIKTVKAEDTIAVNFAYTYPDFRRTGIATNTLSGLLESAASNKMTRCSVDCESENREGAGFWVKHFKPACYAVMRKIDDRIRLSRL